MKVFERSVMTKTKFMKSLSKGTNEIKFYDDGAEREVKYNENES